MIHPLTPQNVTVNRFNVIERAEAVGVVFGDVHNPQNPAQPLRGPFLGVTIRIGGQMLYAQLDQLEGFVSGEIVN